MGVNGVWGVKGLKGSQGSIVGVREGTQNGTMHTKLKVCVPPAYYVLCGWPIDKGVVVLYY